MNLLMWAMLGGIAGWLASFFANTYRQYVMCLDVELMTVAAFAGALLPVLNGGIRDFDTAAEPSLLVLFLSALQ